MLRCGAPKGGEGPLTIYQLVILSLGAFLAGAAAGSAFLRLLDRKSRGEAWAGGGSRCAGCGRRLPAGDLAPIYGYVRSRGRCRHCGKPYPIAALLSPLAMGYGWLCGAWGAYLAYAAGDYPGMAAKAVIYVLLGAAAVNDIYCHECGFVIQYGILAAGLVYAFFFCRSTAVLLGCAGVMAVLVLIDFLFRRVRRMEGIGLADIIVLSGTAAIVDEPFLVPLMVLLTNLFGMMCVPIALKNQKMQGTEEPEGPSVGLLPFVLLGVSVCNLLGRLVIPLLLHG